MKYYILCMITAISINAFSQTLKIKVQDKTIELKSSSTNLSVDNIVELIKDKNQNDIAVFSNYLGLKDITEGQYKGQKTGDYKEGLSFLNGNKFEFAENEYYLGNINSYIYTNKIDFLNTDKKVNIYQISNNDLTKSSISIKIPYNNSFDRIPNSELFISSNLDDGVGDEIKIFDKNLNIINTYKPIENGFSDLLFSSMEGNIFIISTPIIHTNQNKRFKVTIINAKSNYSTTEVNYADEIIPQRIIALENNFVLICIGKMMLFSKQGELLWTKSMNVSSTEFAVVGCESESKLFIISEEAIVCLDFSQGNELWKKSLKFFYPGKEEPIIKRNEYYMSYVPIDFKSIPSLKVFCLISAKMEQIVNDGTTKISYSNKNLTIFDYNGNIVTNIPLKTTEKSSTSNANFLQGRIRVCQLIIEDNGFKIINDGKIEKYEK